MAPMSGPQPRRIWLIWKDLEWYARSDSTPDLLVRSQIQPNLASLAVFVTYNSFKINEPVDLR